MKNAKAEVRRKMAGKKRVAKENTARTLESKVLNTISSNVDPYHKEGRRVERLLVRHFENSLRPVGHHVTRF